MDYEPVDTRPRRSLAGPLTLALIAFLLGTAAAGWVLANWDAAARTIGIAPDPVPPPAAVASAPALAPPAAALAQAEAPRLVLDPQTQKRVAALEQRILQIESQSRAAVGDADRAEGLLVAFAARRALDRGVALGYLEALLRQRFGATRPQAVGTIIAAARQPVRIEELKRELADVGPELAGGGAGANWWTSLRSELGGLVTVRRKGTQSTIPSERLRRARGHIDVGEVNLALVEVLRMPGRERARPWIDKARRYVAARNALDAIETAALLDPMNPPQQPARAAPAPAPTPAPAATR